MKTRTKTCARCLTPRMLSSFNKDIYNLDKLSYICKFCLKKENGTLENITHRKLRYKQTKKIEIEKLARGECKKCNKQRLPNHNRFCEFHYIYETSTKNLGTAKFAKQLYKLLKTQNYKCAYSGKPLILGLNASLDHIFPRSRFPELAHEISNIHWVDMSINKLKHNFLESEILEISHSFVDSIENKRYSQENNLLKQVKLLIPC